MEIIIPNAEISAYFADWQYIDARVRLFDIKLKQKSLKAAWFPKILKNDFFKFCFFENTSLPKTNLVFENNLHPSDAANYCNPNEFWGQTLIHWCEFGYSEPQDGLEVCKQPLWFNSNIKVDGQILFLPALSDLGINKIHDIITQDEHKTFLTHAALVKKIALCGLRWFKFNWCVKMSKRCQISKSQTCRLWRRFTKKNKLT